MSVVRVIILLKVGKGEKEKLNCKIVLQSIEIV